MTSENKTQETDSSVVDFIAAQGDQQVVSDCNQLIGIMGKVTGCEPKLWGPAIIGFDTYHYVYDSGREGDAPVIAFSPRKGKLVLYIDETERFADLLGQLGKHTTGKVCVYIKRLNDVDIDVLTRLIEASCAYTKSRQ